MNKLKLALHILRSRNYVVVTADGDTISTSVHHESDLAGIMLLAVGLKQLYDSLMKEIENQAIENGEIAALQALQKTANAVEKEFSNGRDQDRGSESSPDENK